MTANLGQRRASAKFSGPAKTGQDRTGGPKGFSRTTKKADERRAEEEIARTWKDFKRTGDGHLRNVLVERYLYLVKVIANRISARLPRSIDVQDLRSAGIFGLIRAIENFDTSRGTRFESYCATRVHGAILDELRAQDFVPRLVRNRADLYRTAFNELRRTLDRDPSTREIAIHLGTTDEDANALRRESNLTTVYTLSRDDETSEDSHQVRKLDVLVDRDSEVPFDDLVTRDLAASFANHLTRTERTVVALYYVDSLTMREIGEVLSISESRVCQIHTKLLKKLKTHLIAIINGTDKPVRVPELPRYKFAPGVVAKATPPSVAATLSVSSNVKPVGPWPKKPARSSAPRSAACGGIAESATGS